MCSQHQILWVQGCQGHTISRRESNLFKPLRRHFRASPLCRQALPRRGAGDRNAAVQEMDDRLLPPGLREARHAPRLEVAGGGSGNGFDVHSASSFRAAAREQT